MKRLLPLFAVVLLLLWFGQSRSSAQMAAVPKSMNFQGRLAKPDGTPVANGNYDLQFSLYDASAAGTLWWQRNLTNVPVKNGVFAAKLDFSGGYQNGATQTGVFEAPAVYLEIKVGNNPPLTPRQQLVTVAYAFKADNVRDNSITSASIVNGTITGADIADGTLTAVKFAANTFNPLAWLLGGNSGTNPGSHFLGTTDNQPLVFRTNNSERMRLDSNGNLGLGTKVPAFPLAFNSVTGDKISFYGAAGPHYGIGLQPYLLQIHTDSDLSDIAFGYGTSTAFTETMRIKGNGQVFVNGLLSVNAGGLRFPDGTVQTTAYRNGVSNFANALTDTAGGGTHNTADGYAATVGGGAYNTANGYISIVAGGNLNIASGAYGTVAGGYINTASADSATVAGGYSNIASNSGATVAGGSENTATGAGGTIPGGYRNLANGSNSFAAGALAKASHDGTFVWKSYDGTEFASTAANQFLISASGGVGINTNTPAGSGLTIGNGNPLVLKGASSTGSGNVIFQNNTGDQIGRIYTNPALMGFCVGSDFGPKMTIDFTGQVNANSFGNLSDARYKTRIQSFSNALEAVLNLRGVTFDWNREQWKEKDFPEGRQIGFIAQEVEKVLPELVKADAKGFKSVAYQNVVPVLVEAVKTLKAAHEDALNALQKENRAVRKENAELKAALADILKRLEKVEANRR